MKTAFLASAIICMLAISGFFMDATVQENRLLGDAAAAVQQIGGMAEKSQEPIAEILNKVSATADSAKQTADSINKLETENQAKYAGSITETAKVIAAVKSLVERTDTQLTKDEVGLLPQTQKAIMEFSDRSDETLDALTSSSKSLGNAADSLNRTVSDPHILETFDNVDRATRSLSQTSAHLDNISAMGELEVKRLTMPASLAKRIAFGTLSTAAKVGSAFAGFR